MKTSILENQEFILGVEEEWNSYYEVTVNFIKEASLAGYTYHLFIDKNVDKFYFLRPRFGGHLIESIFVEKQIIVNIAKKDADIKQDVNKPPIFFATGVLKLPKN